MSKIEIKVRVIGDRQIKVHELPSDTRVEDLLEKLDKNRETVVVKRNEKIVPEEETLEERDKITIIPVVSGG
ncbi:hypothetical protein AKJ63_00615 [candidate division MSBL1 archaeon SCGC-AAA259D18]|uniref:Thiamine biosynthesis protein ThiS n=2 Tax=candidate division MSBL1 TaxID=215777 RepID=A0A133U9P6_9EURY|nr:hypothetical protein AKJ57_03140 [candidate division MSBL1 archaeon SCGC-AAA259A05]KXA91871.1 hypothetical protein AKJ63_00615 [candidate division MSBL1 archaeon SCGC-AAA259D18]